MTDLAGLRVFLVEDEGIVALMIEEMLGQLGCNVVASVASLAKARAVAPAIEADVALLDVNLGGHLVFPVADILKRRGMPIVFSTGYGTGGLPSEFFGYPVLAKPYSVPTLCRAIESLIGDL